MTRGLGSFGPSRGVGISAQVAPRVIPPPTGPAHKPEPDIVYIPVYEYIKVEVPLDEYSARELLITLWSKLKSAVRGYFAR